MKNFIKIFMMLFVFQITTCMNEGRVETIQRTIKVENLKIKSKLISQGVSDDISKEYDNNIIQHVLNFFIEEEYLNTRNTGTLNITERYPGVVIATDIPPHHHIRWNHNYGTQNNEPQKVFNCTYVTPNSNSDLT